MKNVETCLSYELCVEAGLVDAILVTHDKSLVLVHLNSASFGGTEKLKSNIIFKGYCTSSWINCGMAKSLVRT